MFSENEPISIQTFGRFTIRRGDAVISETDNRSKKLWKLLEYIVHNRHRPIPQEELIALLWGEEGQVENRLSSLKTLLHRARNTLDGLNFPESRHLILRRGKCYCWNRGQPLRMDCEEFAAMAERTRKTDEPEEKLDLALRAMALYRGSYLGGQYAGEKWASEAAKHYRGLFLLCYNAAIQILVGEAQYEQVVFLSRRAMELEPSNETFYYNEISALIANGEGEEALRAYRRVLDFFYQTYRKTPSERLRALYRGIPRGDNGIEPDLAIVREGLDAACPSRAVCCEYDTFRLLYGQSRLLGGTRYLIILTVVPADSSPQATRHLDRVLIALEACLSELLSAGDFYTRYSLTQWLALATFSTEDALRAALAKLRSPHPDMQVLYQTVKI